MIFRGFVFLSLVAKGLSLSLERARSKSLKSLEELDEVLEKARSNNEKSKTVEKVCCPICLEEFLVKGQKPDPDMEHADDPIVHLGCGHEFHGKCVETWFQKQAQLLPDTGPTCPSCRADVRTEVRSGKMRYVYQIARAPLLGFLRGPKHHGT